MDRNSSSSGRIPLSSTLPLHSNARKTQTTDSNGSSMVETCSLLTDLCASSDACDFAHCCGCATLGALEETNKQGASVKWTICLFHETRQKVALFSNHTASSPSFPLRSAFLFISAQSHRVQMAGRKLVRPTRCDSGEKACLVVEKMRAQNTLAAGIQLAVMPLSEFAAH